MSVLDPYVVKNDDLLKFLERWIQIHYADYPPDTNKVGDSFRFYGALSYLADHMEGSFKTNFNKLHRIRKVRPEYTSLYIADEILAAMEETYRLHTEIPIYPRSVIREHRKKIAA